VLPESPSWTRRWIWCDAQTSAGLLSIAVLTLNAAVREGLRLPTDAAGVLWCRVSTSPSAPWASDAAEAVGHLADAALVGAIVEAIVATGAGKDLVRRGLTARAWMRLGAERAATLSSSCLPQRFAAFLDAIGRPPAAWALLPAPYAIHAPPHSPVLMVSGTSRMPTSSRSRRCRHGSRTKWLASL
jgi:hypothetical protein